jgi:hypothetical protein
MSKKYLISLLYILLFSLALQLSLADFQVVITPVADEINIEESASFDLYVVNLGRATDSYELSFTNDGSWSIETDPLAHLSGFSLDAGESKTTTVVLTPTSLLKPSKYTFPFSVVTDSSEEQSFEFVFTLLGDIEYSGYLPSLNIDVDVATKLDPRDNNLLTVYITNRNQLDVTDLLIDITSNYYSTQRLTTLEPLGQLIETFDITYDYGQLPTDDLFEISVTASGKTFGPLRKEIEIISYLSLDEELIEEKEFLKTTTTYKFTNNGNIEDTEFFTLETSFFSQLFTKTEPKTTTIKDNGKRYYQYDMTLTPGESTSLVLTKNYRTLAAVILLIILSTIAYYIFRSPVVAKKQAKILTMQDSGISKMKVLLHVKNRTGKVIDNILVTDRIPHIAEIIKDFEVGTLKPEKIIKHEKQGVLLRWTFSQLEPYEERIITYMVKTKLNIVGGFCLPSAMVKFKNKKKKFVKVYSNKARCK